MMNSGLVPGAACINVLMRRHLNVDLTDAQANALWAECRAKLADADLQRTIAAAKASYYGSLSKAFEADLSHMLWKCFMSVPHPRPTDSPDKLLMFQSRLESAITQRGYKKSQHQINPLQLAS